jgi:hypothetical protein
MDHPVLRPLTSHAQERLHWAGGFQYEGMVRIRTVMGASSLLHAVLNAFFVPYRSNQINQTVLGRKELVDEYRAHLAERLEQPYDPTDATSPAVYDCLARGKMKEFADLIKEYQLDVMRSELSDPDFFLDVKYLELLANELSKDIYVLNGLTEDVHVFDHADTEMYYKGRPVVVVLFLPEHFELVGIHKPNGDVVTHFAPDSPFVDALRRRYDDLKARELAGQ